MKRLACAALVFMAAAPAAAQDVRNWDRQVERGREMQFQWLNYDEATCVDRGPARFVLTTAPKLGTFRTQRSSVTPQSGACAGKRLSVLFVYYRAGQRAGLDETSYTIVGGSPITVNLRFTVF
jgi:hypothetical protein